MTWDRLIEIAILITLWIEFWYDAHYNSLEQRKKRKPNKPRIVYEKDMD